MHAFGNHAGHGVTIHHMFTHIMIYIHIHEYTYIYCFSYLDVLKPHFSIIHAYTYIYICIHTYTYIYIHILTSSWAGRPGNSLMTGCLPIFLQIKGVGRDHTLTPIASDIRVRLQSSLSRSCTHSALTQLAVGVTRAAGRLANLRPQAQTRKSRLHGPARPGPEYRFSMRPRRFKFQSRPGRRRVNLEFTPSAAPGRESTAERHWQSA